MNPKREENLKQSAKRWTLNRAWADWIHWKVGTKQPSCSFPSRKQVCYIQLNIDEQGAWRCKGHSSYPHLISTWESEAILLVGYLTWNGQKLLCYCAESVHAEALCEQCGSGQLWQVKASIVGTYSSWKACAQHCYCKGKGQKLQKKTLEGAKHQIFERNRWYSTIWGGAV